MEPGPAWTAPLRGVVNEEWNAAAGEQERWMDEELTRWASTGVCEEVQDEELMCCPGIYHPLKVADKPGWEQLVGEARWRKKYRLCVAVRKAFNRSLPDVRTHLKGLAEALRILRDGDEVCKSDAEMGYFHVVLHPACRRYFWFRRGGRAWQMRVVFFGLKTAGYVFSTMMACWVRLLHLPTGVPGCPKEHGLRMSRYMDDVMYAHEQGKLREVQRRWIWPTSSVLGGQERMGTGAGSGSSRGAGAGRHAQGGTQAGGEGETAGAVKECGAEDKDHRGGGPPTGRAAQGVQGGGAQWAPHVLGAGGAGVVGDHAADGRGEHVVRGQTTGALGPTAQGDGGNAGDEGRPGGCSSDCTLGGGDTGGTRNGCSSPWTPPRKG